jgi:hypothetical protein
VKASLPILPRIGVWIRLTRNLDKARGFVNGALGQIDEVFRHDRGVVVFSLRLVSGTMVMVHPVSYSGETFLPCAYGYGCTVRRTQGLSLWHGALFLDGRIYPRPRGHAYVGVSRFRRALGVFHYGPLRRSDWLPTLECEEEQDRPGDLSPGDWDTSSDDSDDSRGGLGAHYRDSMCGMADGSDSEGQSDGPPRRDLEESSEEEDPNADMACALPESDSEGPAEVDVGLRCASPEPVPVASESTVFH